MKLWAMLAGVATIATAATVAMADDKPLIVYVSPNPDRRERLPQAGEGGNREGRR